MSDRITSRLVALSEELAELRTELDIAREQLVFFGDVLEERRVEMLVAETPLAAREHRIALENRDRMAAVVAEAEARAAALAEERDRLLDALSGANPAPTGPRTTF
jgi:hypothetical protein